MSADTDIRSQNLPEGWEWKPLREVAATSAGGTPKAKTPAFYDDGDIPWLKIGDLNDGLVTSASTYITQAGLDGSSAKWLEPGTILVAMYGSIGKLGLLQVRATTNQAICAMYPTRAVTTEWLFWYIREQRYALDALGRGGAQRNISQGDLKKWLIPVPPLDEQRAIVAAIEDAFARIDAIEAELRAVHTSRDSFKAAVLRDAFSGALSSQLPAGGGMSADTDTRDQDLPEGWGWKELGEVADCELGRMLDESKNAGDPHPYLGNANVRWGCFKSADLSLIRIEARDLDRYTVQQGDLVVCEGGEPGRCAVWRGDSPVAFQKALHRVRPRDDLDVEYLAAYFRYATRSPWFRDLLTGTTIKHLPKQALRRLRLPVPPLDEQRAIVAAIEDAFARIDAIEAATTKAEAGMAALRASVLHRAFTGELSVAHASEKQGVA